MPPPKSPLAIWSLVCGILTFLCLGPLAGIAAIICGHLALGAIKRSQGTLGGTGLAVAGLVLGYFGTVIVGLALVAALVFPAISAAKDGARRAKARQDELSIVHAVEQYETTYGQNPDPAGGERRDVTVAEDNHKLFNILRDLEPDHRNNPKRQVFFTAPDAHGEGKPRDGFDSNGVFRDPWGNPYLIRIDLNGDGVVEDPYGTSPTDTIQVSVIVWSLGPDGLPGSHGSGDILSWSSR
ncbi:MAG TPA: DUF4190 domain-containing protein [Chthoniobacteraceae bacterium]|nr:DUF4190 domain-containing protein [Chthoniobacteraceae bacterium]